MEAESASMLETWHQRMEVSGEFEFQARASTDNFFGFLCGKVSSKWTGSVLVGLREGVKVLYFEQDGKRQDVGILTTWCRNTRSWRRRLRR